MLFDAKLFVNMHLVCETMHHMQSLKLYFNSVQIWINEKALVEKAVVAFF